MLQSITNNVTHFYKEYIEKHVTQLRPVLERFLETLSQTIPDAKQWLTLMGIYAFTMGVFEIAIQYLFYTLALKSVLQWTVGFRPQNGPAYNIAFFSYLTAVFTMMGGYVGVQILNYLPKLRSWIFRIVDQHWGKVFALAAIGFVMTPHFFSSCCFMLTLITLGWRMIVDVLPTLRIIPKKYDHTVQAPAYTAVICLLMLGVAGSLYLAGKTWYPIKLVNDYLELEDKVAIPFMKNNLNDDPVYMKRSQAIKCLLAPEGPLAKEIIGETTTITSDEMDIAMRYSKNAAMTPSMMMRFFPDKQPDALPEGTLGIKYTDFPCQTPFTQLQSDILRQPLLDSSFWQSQAGRTLYHHSYMFVPAVHFLKYGLSTPIPYLYGLGNTMFNAWLIKAEPTITRYFEAYPIAQMTGIVLIVMLVFYMTRSFLVVPLACVALLIPLWNIHFEAIQMAPGFNPLRYAGLVVQFASIFFLFRRQNITGLVALGCGLLFSLFWNKEFAILGFFGQMLALMAPQLKLPAWGRFTAVTFCIVLSIVSIVWLDGLSKGFLQTIQAGLYGVSVPALRAIDLIFVCVGAVVYTAVALVMTLGFNSQERMARLCIIPVIWMLMIKFIYNPSSAHMLFTLSFIAPVTLALWNWKEQHVILAAYGLEAQHQKKFISFVLMLAVMANLAFAYHYRAEAKERANLLLDLFEKHSWANLNERFITTTPSDPIETRMKALNEQIKPDDAVVYLSPFDHLMSFYSNPKRYCGHFEYLTNLVTYANIDDVVECVRRDTNALLVYDDAVFNKCPNLLHIKFYVDDVRTTLNRLFLASQGTMDSCEAKNKLYQSMQVIMDRLKPELVLVKKDGPLSFYRHPSHPESQAEVSSVKDVEKTSHVSEKRRAR